jgi:hypothetical protein
MNTDKGQEGLWLSFVLLGRFDWQADRDDRAGIYHARNLNGATMFGHNGLADGKAKPRASRFPTARLVAPIKSIEHIGQSLGWDPHSIILDTKLRDRSLPSQPGSHLRAGRAMLDRIQDEIGAQ